MLVVGDLHSRHEHLERLLGEVWDGNEQLVFLGDLNDSSDPDHHFWPCYERIRALEEAGAATVLHSNHQEKLIGALDGETPTWVALADGLDNTMEQLAVRTRSEREQLKVWLSSLPSTYQSDNLVFAHAYPGGTDKDKIYGPRDERGHRIAWWQSEASLLPPPLASVVGHYRKLHFGERAVVLDAGSEGLAWARPNRANLTMSSWGIVRIRLASLT